jgi:hypothetical protein
MTAPWPRSIASPQGPRTRRPRSAPAARSRSPPDRGTDRRPAHPHTVPASGGRAPVDCPACGERLGTSRGVLFQGDWLVHAACWRDDPKPFDLPGRVALSPRSEAPQRPESSGASIRQTRCANADPICTGCGEPIRGAAYRRPDGGAVHAVGCSFPEHCPTCDQDLWEDGFLLMAGEFWHLGCSRRPPH